MRRIAGPGPCRRRHHAAGLLLAARPSAARPGPSSPPRRTRRTSRRRRPSAGSSRSRRRRRHARPPGPRPPRRGGIGGRRRRGVPRRGRARLARHVRHPLGHRRPRPRGRDGRPGRRRPSRQRQPVPISIDECSAITRAAEKVSPAIVHDRRERRRRRPDRPVLRLPQSGVGSGVIFDSDGWILTNKHVVAGATDAHRRRSRTAASSTGTVYGIDTLTDLAIVKIDATGLTAAPIGDSSDGQGRPAGDRHRQPARDVHELGDARDRLRLRPDDHRPGRHGPPEPHPDRRRDQPRQLRRAAPRRRRATSSASTPRSPRRPRGSASPSRSTSPGRSCSRRSPARSWPAPGSASTTWRSPRRRRGNKPAGRQGRLAERTGRHAAGAGPDRAPAARRPTAGLQDGDIITGVDGTDDRPASTRSTTS